MTASALVKIDTEGNSSSRRRPMFINPAGFTCIHSAVRMNRDDAHTT